MDDTKNVTCAANGIISNNAIECVFSMSCFVAIVCNWAT